MLRKEDPGLVVIDFQGKLRLLSYMKLFMLIFVKLIMQQNY